MTKQQHEDMPIKLPVDPNAIDAIHIDSPAKCFNCPKQDKSVDYDKLREDNYHQLMTS